MARPPAFPSRSASLHIVMLPSHAERLRVEGGGIDLRCPGEWAGADLFLVIDDAGTASNTLHNWADEARAAGVPVVAACRPERIAHCLLEGADTTLALPSGVPLHAETLRAVSHAASRLRNAARPSPSHAPLNEAPQTVAVGPLTLNRRARLLFIRNEPVHLTLKEFELLDHLMSRCGDCCSRDDLLNGIWGEDVIPDSNTLDVLIYALRSKLRKHGQRGRIQTVRGVGYRLASSMP